MSETRHIFRSDAVQRYIAAREQSVLPRFIRPPIFACMWLLVLLGLCGAAVSWSIELPLYSAGSAVVLRDPAARQPDVLILAAFLPAKELQHLSPGQKILVRISRDQELLQPVQTVVPEVVGPDQARRRFGIAADVEALQGPAAVAIAPFVPPDGVAPETYLGSIYQVHIQVGTQRALALLPVIGQLFEE